jgi:hypothetical protein
MQARGLRSSCGTARASNVLRLPAISARRVAAASVATPSQAAATMTPLSYADRAMGALWGGLPAMRRAVRPRGPPLQRQRNLR